MADIATDESLVAVLRRFGLQPLSGADLTTIRREVLGMTQSQLGDVWGVTRGQVSRAERRPAPSKRICDAYIGVMARSLAGALPTAESR